jgi:hypothetical protein
MMGGGGGNPGPSFGGDPFSGIGREGGFGGGGNGGFQNLEAKPVGYGSASGGDESDDAGDAQVPDQVPAQPRAVAGRGEVIQLNASPDGHRFVLDAMGTLVRLTVCKGADAEKVALCQTLADRARAKRARQLPPDPPASSLSPALGEVSP